jgi:uncharacterized protein
MNMDINLIPVIIAGVTTGGLTCFAVQGGLLTTVLTKIKKKQEIEGNDLLTNLMPTLGFLGAKITIYTILGALLGIFGSFFSISTTVQAWIQIIIAVYMVGVALQLLGVHPIFRYFIIQPPAKLQRMVRKVAKGNDELTTPILLGLTTLIIPCGTTLAMEALAISSGNAVTGALIMFLFTLSSSWIFVVVGAAASQFNQVMQQYFYKATAAALIILAGMSFNGGLNLLGSPYTVEGIASIFQKPQTKILGAEDSSKNISSVPADFESQQVTIKVTSSGYKADKDKLRKGVPVKLTLETHNTYSCASAFTIPNLGIQKILPASGKEVITFTPQKSGLLAYSCSMGMYRGNFIVE